MRIALIGPSFPFKGGISYYTTLLFRILKRRHEVVFFSFSRQYPKWFFPGKSDIDPSDIYIREAESRRVVDSLNPVTWLKVVWTVRRSNHDVLIIPWWVSFWAPLFAFISVLVRIFTKTKILFLCHNVVPHDGRIIDKGLARLVLRNGDFFIVHSKQDEMLLKEILPNALVRRVFHPLYDVFHMHEKENNNVRKRFKIEPDDNLILFFGFVRPYKGLSNLIRALPEVLQQEEVKLLVAGEFWKDKEFYLELIESLDLMSRVVIVDEYIPNEAVQGYFNSADLVVQPYVSATGSGVIQTAFAFNKPVIATRVGSLPEIIEDGKTGYIVPPEAPQELAKAIVRFFQERKGKIFSKNIQRVKHKFTWDKIVDCIEELAGFES
jgi:glycosyltransferase involved in cell wall biosynthesis